MIDKVRIRNYRKLRDVTFSPNAGLNVLVGDNGSGKSTILEAVTLALTGRINGRSAHEELNPFWFNENVVREFFERRQNGKAEAPPTLCIEVFLSDLDEYQRLAGAHNSDTPTRGCPGIAIDVVPNPEYQDDLEQFLQGGGTVLPTDFYRVVWRDFADNTLQNRPKPLKTAVIDSRTLRSTTGIDFHLREILSAHLGAEEKAKISAAYTRLKDGMTRSELETVNTKIADLGGTLDEQPLRLGMDQTSKTSWDASVVPYVSSIPFSMAGQGQQAAVKISLAMARDAEATRFVMVEEPENHLSHTNLNKLLKRFDDRGEHQQIFVATHSSFVLNRLGLNGLVFVCDGNVSGFADIPAETVRYFQKLPGYDTLRMVLADRFVMVEGPSDEILFEKLYRARYARRPIEDRIDVVSMRGLSFKRGLELAKRLGKKCAVVRDNDGKTVASRLENLASLLEDGKREAFVGEDGKGDTLEPQIHAANEESILRAALQLKEKQSVLDWMLANKTEWALRLAESDAVLTAPAYIEQAIQFIHDAQ